MKNKIGFTKPIWLTNETIKPLEQVLDFYMFHCDSNFIINNTLIKVEYEK